MQQCPNCGHLNRAGVVFCENCGASLIGKMPLDTKSLESSTDAEKAEVGIDSSVLTDVKVQGVSKFAKGDLLKLEIEGSPDPIIFEPKDESIFGRRDPATGAMPDVDLTPFAGYRMGVSRRHAAIRQSDEQSLDIWDLGSSNGTYLNGQRLSAHRPYRLHNGDEIRLGQMIIRVMFESTPPDKPTPEKQASAPTTDTTASAEKKAETKPPDEPTSAQQAQPSPAAQTSEPAPSQDKAQTDKLGPSQPAVEPPKSDVKPAAQTNKPAPSQDKAQTDKLGPSQPAVEPSKSDVKPADETAPQTSQTSPAENTSGQAKQETQEPPKDEQESTDKKRD